MLRHAYDALGNRISTTLPDGRVLNSLHYGSGHVHQINFDGQVISDFERDALHRERSRSQGALQSWAHLRPQPEHAKTAGSGLSPAEATEFVSADLAKQHPQP